MHPPGAPIITREADFRKSDAARRRFRCERTSRRPIETNRLGNSGTQPLVMIEVQCGDYLGEDDIVRFEDSYGRVK